MSLDVYLYINVDIGGEEKEQIELFSANITHNLGRMADVVGIYKHLWRPEEIGIEQAKDLINALRIGLNRLKEKPKQYKKYDDPNGWGTYSVFVNFVERYLKACKRYPKAMIEVSR